MVPLEVMCVLVPKISWSPFHSPPASRRRQEVDWVHDRHGQHTFLRAEVHGPDAAHHLSGEIRSIHVTPPQREHRNATVRLDRQAEYHLSFERRVVAQLPVVQPVERRLVTVEHDLYFFVGGGGSRPAAGFRPVAGGDRGDRAGRAAYPNTR